MTNAQRMLWTAERLADDAPVYSMAFAFVIDAVLDLDRLDRSLRVLVDEAETMRMIVSGDIAEPIVTLLASFDFDREILDLSDTNEPVEAFLTWAASRTEEPMDLAQEPFDSVVVKLDSNRTGWFFRQHHLFADAWGFAILFRRLAEIYESIEKGPKPDGHPLVSFVELAEPSTPVLDAPSPEATGFISMYGWRRTSQAGTASTRVEIDLGRDRMESLRRLLEKPGWQALTRDLGVFRVLTTALFAYLHRISGDESIQIGAPVHNRPSARHRRAPGLFTEVFPLSVDLGREETFESLHKEVVGETDRFLRSSGSGLSSGQVNRNLNVVLNYLPMSFGNFAGARVESHWVHSGHTEAGHQLRIHVTDFDSTGGLKLLVDCSDDVLPSRRRERAVGHFLRVLDAMLEDPGAAISSVDLTEPEERREILAQAAGQIRSVDQTVLDWFSREVDAHPQRVAMSEGEGSWTYRDMDEWTSQAAGGLEKGTVIGICLPRSVDAVLVMIAVLRAGSVFVPIDPSWPAERIDFVIRDAGCTLVVGERPEGSASEIDFIPADRLRSPGEQLDAVGGADTAYILYTSGSTGTPKGVVVSHSSLANYVSWAGAFYGGGLTFPLFSPLTFDLTITSIFVPLCTGGSIRVYEDRARGLDLSVRDVFQEDAVDIVKLTPSHLTLLTDLDLRSSRVSQLILGGEDLTVPLARRTRSWFGGEVAIHNEYGPTEATVGCILHTFNESTDRVGSVPIGKPIQNMTAVVLDRSGNLAPFGVAGRLWVGGASVSNGYLNRLELTRQKFVVLAEFGGDVFYDTGDLARMREDGTIEYLGRDDDQVKVLGTRIELGEVEAAIAGHPDVVAAVATVFRREPTIEPERTFNCLRCGLPDNYPGIRFDDSGICNQCRAFEEYRERAGTYFKSMSDLQAILAKARQTTKSEYDCISLLSGGKDSTYALGRLVDLGVKPLAFTLDNGYISEEAKENIRRVTEALGVDHVFGSTPAMNDIFVDSLERHANVCNGCFKTIYTLSLKLAKERGIPLIVTGLSRGQFFETRLTEDLFREPGITSEAIDARVLETRKAYHRVDDAPRRLLDIEIFETDQIFEDVQFADFYRYCDVGLEEVFSYLRSRLPWVRPKDTGRSTNCLINDVGIYVHKRERGFHNYALPYSWDVRMGHKTRDEALDELDDQIDVERVQQILEEIGYPEDVTNVEGSPRLVAYYTSDTGVSPNQVREHVESKLPAGMVPRHFVAVDDIPMTAHGKADRDALPDPAHVRPELETSFVAPRNPLEEQIAHTWSEVLGIDKIGVADNFFDLGGDSIMALQIVSRLRRSGLAVEIRELFETLTVEGMARETAAGALEFETMAAGPIPLSPVQHWHFATHLHPEHLSQIVRVEARGPVGFDDLSRCLSALTERHPALRQAFRSLDGGWVSEILPSSPVAGLTRVVGPVPAELPEGRPFDLGEPPLLRAVAYTSESEVLAIDFEAHHLIIDAVSWTVLVDDLNQLLAGMVDGGRSALHGSGSSVRRWLQWMYDRAKEVDPTSFPTAGRGPVPLAAEGGAGRVKLLSKIDPATTQLLRDTGSRQNRIDQMLIASLALSLPKEWVTNDLRLFVEGHGRLVGEVDLSREVGWFTTLTPVPLQGFAGSVDLPQALAAIRKHLGRRDQAADYGSVRYLHPSMDTRSFVAVDYRREILFNYLGELDSGRGSGPLAVGTAVTLGVHDDESVYGLEVNAWIEGGQLAVEWTSPDEPAIVTAAETAATAFESNLNAVCQALRADTRSAAEFPLAGLDDAGLAKLTDVLGRLEK